MPETPSSNKVVWVFISIFVILPFAFVGISSLDLGQNSANAEAIAGLSKADAYEQCEMSVVAGAALPSTVDMSKMTADFYDDGKRATLYATFTAGNMFGASIKQRVFCIFRNGKLEDISIGVA